MLYLTLAIFISFLIGGYVSLIVEEYDWYFSILLISIPIFAAFVFVWINTIHLSIQLYRENDLETLYRRTRNTKLILIHFYLIYLVLMHVFHNHDDHFNKRIHPIIPYY